MVNAGLPQTVDDEGRARNLNTIDCPIAHTSIIQALEQATTMEFKEKSKNAQNIYGDGKAAEKIVNTLTKLELGTELVKKTFADSNPQNQE